MARAQTPTAGAPLLTMIDTQAIIAHFYTPGTPLWDVLFIHSEQVAQLARELCRGLVARGMPVDEEFVVEAAMLHDIGIVRVDAPGIHCHGDKPYVCHGVEGRAMLEELGLYRHALVCERHTGSGITAEEIIVRQMPLPARDMLPLSLEEKVVCYADKFFSKTHLGEPAKPIARVREQLVRYGVDSLARFDALTALLCPQD